MAWGQTCLIDGMVLLSASKRMGFKTAQSYDTGVSYRDCTGECSLDDVATWLEGAKVVPPDYNRKLLGDDRLGQLSWEPIQTHA